MSCNAEPDLVVVVLCDPPGHGSSSTQCGGNDFLEPLVLTQNDSWTAQDRGGERAHWTLDVQRINGAAVVGASFGDV
jgi:pimeloyl-ACP methyl ester carboxylesterase